MTHQEILFKIDWEVKKQERFLNLVSRANRMKLKDREMIIKDVCWVDGTLSEQVQYAQRRREKLMRAYERIMKKHIRK